MKPLLVFAHMEEAQAIIRHYNAKSHQSPSFYHYFSSEEVDIIISGMGVFNSTIATVHTLSRRTDISCVLNIGLAGSVGKPLHTWFAVSSVHYRSCRTHYTDAIFSKVTYSPLMTVDRPATRNEMCQRPDFLYDMEGYGFFESSRKFLENHRIHLLKFVSDNDGKPDSIRNALDLYNQTILKVTLNALSELQIIISQSHHPGHQNFVLSAVKEFGEKQRLSFSQIQLLIEQSIFLLNSGKSESINRMLITDFMHIRDRDRRYKEIIAMLFQDE